MMSDMKTMLTADTITDAQIQALRLDLARELDLYRDLRNVTWEAVKADYDATERALGRIRKRDNAPGVKAAARARCAEILNFERQDKR